MIKVDIQYPDEFEVDASEIESSMVKVLTENGEDDVYVSVAVVDGEEMKRLVRDYYVEDNEEHPVLSFPTREVDEKFARPDGLEDLGEIILNNDYSEGHDLVGWAEHGTLHLVGIHHD